MIGFDSLFWILKYVFTAVIILSFMQFYILTTFLKILHFMRAGKSDGKAVMIEEASREQGEV